MKRVQFQDSKAMDQLEQRAIKEGWLKPAITKEAEIKVVASNDWEENVVALAAHLRTRGFIKEADELADKYFTWKKLANLTEEAHPEGDVAVADASGDLAKVETTDSRHAKMVEVLKKQPTGKQANLESWLVSVADELGVSLSKIAQEIPVQEDLATTSVEKKDEKKNYYFTDRQNLINKNLAAVNTYVSNGLKPIGAKIEDILISVNLKSFTFTALAIEQSIKTGGAGQYQLYLQYSGTKPSALGSFMLTYYGIFGNNLDPKAQLEYAMGKLTQNNPAAVKGYLDNIAPGIYEKYYIEQNAGAWEIGGFTFSGALENIAKKAYAEIVAVLKSKDAAAWGGLDKADTTIQGIIQKTLADLETVKKSIDGFVQLIPNQDTSNLKTIDQLVKIQQAINSIKVDPKISEAFEDAKLLNVQDLSASVGSLVQGVKKMPISVDDIYPSAEDVANLGAKFYQMGKNLDAYLGKLDPNSAEAKKESPFLKKLEAISTAINESKDHPIAKMVEAISTIVPSVKSYADVQKLADIWGDYYSKLSQASKNIKMIKLAEPPGLPSAPVPGATAKPISSVTPKSNPNLPNNAAVMKMQKALVDLANAFKAAGGTSPEDLAALVGGKTDGIWGSGTTTALKKANDLLQTTLLQITPTQTDSADANTSVLEKALQNAANGSPVNDQILDSLPEGQINWDVMDMSPVQPDNPVKVRASDLNDLTSYVNFLFQNRLTSPQKAPGKTEFDLATDGISLETILKSLKWFFKRAQLQYDRYHTDPKLTVRVKQYGDLIKTLYSDWQQIANGMNTDQVRTTILPAGQLAMMTGGLGSGQGNASEMTPGQYQEQGKGNRDYDGRGGRGTRNNPQNNAPPIGEMIDLRNPLWGAGGQYQFKVSLVDIENQPAQYLAKALFGDATAMPADQAQTQALKLIGFNDETSLKTSGTPAQIQAYQQAYQRYTSQGPMNALRDFLNFLDQHIAPVVRNWMNNTRPPPVQDEVDNTMNYRARWVAAVGRRLSEIGTWTLGK